MGYNTFICSNNSSSLEEIAKMQSQAIIYYGDFDAYAVQLSSGELIMSDEEVLEKLNLKSLPAGCWKEWCDYRP